MSTRRLHDPAGYSGHLHCGIQYWEADGSKGFLLEVVWLLRVVPTTSSSQPAPPRDGYHAGHAAGLSFGASAACELRLLLFSLLSPYEFNQFAEFA